MSQLPYFRQQANQLLETGSCDLTLTMDDVADRVAKNPIFPAALQKAVAGNSRVLHMITLTAANMLCQEQDR